MSTFSDIALTIKSGLGEHGSLLLLGPERNTHGRCPNGVVVLGRDSVDRWPGRSADLLAQPSPRRLNAAAGFCGQGRAFSGFRATATRPFILFAVPAARGEWVPRAASL